MYAKNFELLLRELCEKSQISSASASNISSRFDSLRRYGVLPKGRKNRTKLLTDREISGAILGLASTQAIWAGHSAVCLSNLRLVGGPDASFDKSQGLIEKPKQ